MKVGPIVANPVKGDYSRLDPVRYPEIQLRYENEFKDNYSKTLKVMIVDITKILKK